MREAPHISILFESDEWSDHKLARELQAALDARSGNRTRVTLINMEDANALEQALSCKFIISRVFASASFRGHQASLKRMNELIPAVEQAGIPLINPGRAHRFEVSKRASTEALKHAGIDVPAIYGCGTPGQLDEQAGSFTYPCIIKPDCSGRTNQTIIARNSQEARAFLTQAPDMPFIVEEYIEPERGFMTRIEIIGGKPEHVSKRSIANNGLSSYHFGCTYAAYPGCPQELLTQATVAARALGFVFGSFDVIGTERGAFFIDANSVSNVSEDCTELLQIDLMARYAQVLARIITERGM